MTALALLIAERLLPGIDVEGNAWAAFIVTALVLGLVNALIRPVLVLMSCGCIVLTLGFFGLVINGLMLWLASSIATSWFHVGFHLRGFWPAFFGGLIVSVVSVVLTPFLREQLGSDGKTDDKERSP